MLALRSGEARTFEDRGERWMAKRRELEAHYLATGGPAVDVRHRIIFDQFPPPRGCEDGAEPGYHHVNAPVRERPSPVPGLRTQMINEPHNVAVVDAVERLLREYMAEQMNSQQ
jgi:hypothetical protein